jgi:hypothetical protein
MTGFKFDISSHCATPCTLGRMIKSSATSTGLFHAVSAPQFDATDINGGGYAVVLYKPA